MLMLLVCWKFVGSCKHPISRLLSRTAEPFSAGCSKIRLASWLESARRRKFGWQRCQHFPVAARLESAPLSQHTNKC